MGKQEAQLQHQLLLGQYASSLQSEQYSTNNFLQSSTVTSTPIEKTVQHAAASEAEASLGGVVASTMGAHVADNLSAVTVKFEQDDDEEDEDDDKPLSSLHSCSSSGVASNSTHTNASSEKLLLLSGVQPLESTTDSIDSPSMVRKIIFSNLYHIQGVTINKQYHNIIKYLCIYNCYSFLIQSPTFLCSYPTLC